MRATAITGLALVIVVAGMSAQQPTSTNSWPSEHKRMTQSRGGSGCSRSQR